jgi:hypothetical protein
MENALYVANTFDNVIIIENQVCLVQVGFNFCELMMDSFLYELLSLMFHKLWCAC